MSLQRLRSLICRGSAERDGGNLRPEQAADGLWRASKYMLTNLLTVGRRMNTYHVILPDEVATQMPLLRFRGQMDSVLVG